MILDAVFVESAQKNASDIHIKEGEPIMLRVEGMLIKSSVDIIPDKLIMFDLLYTLLYAKKERISFFKHNLDIDFGYTHQDGCSYRGNGYMYMNKIGIAIRRIPDKIENLVELGLPLSLKKILQAKQGLFLVTGPTGSGKSTTMASMVDAINEFREEVIITIEDPIEYVFKNKKSIFSQREIGRDSLSFASALKSAMREDVNIIVIGEIRDAETMDIALTLAETGHLVFSTLHTSGSVQTISRMIHFFPSHLESQIRTRIGESLLGTVAQRLIPRKDKNGRIAIREIMYVNSGIKYLILKGDLSQLESTIELGHKDGMHTMRKNCEELNDKGLIEAHAYSGYFLNSSDYNE